METSGGGKVFFHRIPDARSKGNGLELGTTKWNGKTVKGAKGSDVGVCVEFPEVQSVRRMPSLFIYGMQTKVYSHQGRRFDEMRAKFLLFIGKTTAEPLLSSCLR